MALASLTASRSPLYTIMNPDDPEIAKASLPEHPRPRSGTQPSDRLKKKLKQRVQQRVAAHDTGAAVAEGISDVPSRTRPSQLSEPPAMMPGGASDEELAPVLAGDTPTEADGKTELELLKDVLTLMAEEAVSASDRWLTMACAKQALETEIAPLRTLAFAMRDDLNAQRRFSQVIEQLLLETIEPKDESTTTPEAQFWSAVGTIKAFRAAYPSEFKRLKEKDRVAHIQAPEEPTNAAPEAAQHSVFGQPFEKIKQAVNQLEEAVQSINLPTSSGLVPADPSTLEVGKTFAAPDSPDESPSPSKKKRRRKRGGKKNTSSAPAAGNTLEPQQELGAQWSADLRRERDTAATKQAIDNHHKLSDFHTRQAQSPIGPITMRQLEKMMERMPQIALILSQLCVRYNRDLREFLAHLVREQPDHQCPFLTWFMDDDHWITFRQVINIAADAASVPWEPADQPWPAGYRPFTLESFMSTLPWSSAKTAKD